MEERTKPTFMRRLFALAYSPPATTARVGSRVGFTPPGPLFDASVIGLFLVFGFLAFFR
jgi:hypothetical protein